MTRANNAQKAERLNRARVLLQRLDLPDAVDEMVRNCAVSPRQAYRYLQQAGRLKQDVPVGDAKIAFTVKLSRGLVERVRGYANTRGLSLSDMVGRALDAFLPRRKKRG